MFLCSLLKHFLILFIRLFWLITPILFIFYFIVVIFSSLIIFYLIYFNFVTTWTRTASFHTTTWQLKSFSYPKSYFRMTTISLLWMTRRIRPSSSSLFALVFCFSFKFHFSLTLWTWITKRFPFSLRFFDTVILISQTFFICWKST